MIDIPNDNEWHTIHMDIPDEVFKGLGDDPLLCDELTGLPDDPLVCDCRSAPEPGEIPDTIAEESEPINMVLIYLRLDKPYKSKTTLDIDELEFLEWRPAGLMPERYGFFDFVRNSGDSDQELEVSGLPAR